MVPQDWGNAIGGKDASCELAAGLARSSHMMPTTNCTVAVIHVIQRKTGSEE